MFTIKMMSGDKFNISKETFNKLSGKSGLIYITELDGIINLNSVTSILPKQLSENSGNNRLLSDGTRVLNKFGTWVLESDHSIVIDVRHYPELLKDYDTSQPTKQIPTNTQKNR